MASTKERLGRGARTALDLSARGSRATWRIVSRPVVWMPLVFLGFAGLGVAMGSWRNLCADCPSIAQMYTWEPTQTSKVFASSGELIAELGTERRTPVSIEELPPYVAHAFISIEDKRFYRHHGVDPRGFTRAVVGRLLGQYWGGGSTITQQLARNMFDQLGFQRSVLRKFREMQVAFQLERVYEKNQILEAYINQINYGNGWYGIQTASRNYFGKSASELDPTEAALLAAIPNLPEFYNPLKHPDNAVRRRNTVLRRMAAQGFLPEAELQERMAEPVPTERAEVAEGVAPYFVEYVRRILDDRFGGRLYTDGLSVHTTLDVTMQRSANRAMAEGWRRIEGRPGFRHPKYEEFAEQGSLDVGEAPYVQGAFIAVDPHTGSIKAMVGGRDFRHSKFNRVTQARRQAGSSFKPFVYTAAIESRVPASHIVIDAPVVLPQLDGTEWKPKNFGAEFQGPLTIRDALRQSINMVAIKLAMEVGLETVAQTARRMGIRTEVERFPSTAIGAAEVIPIEMAEAYSSLATLGVRARPFGIARVETAEGVALWEPEPDVARVLDEPAARIVVSMLEGVVNGGTGFTGVRTRIPDVPAAGKTGTTNEGTDTWFVGFTPDLMALVWMGMDRPQNIRPNATGGGDAAPVFGDFMRDVYYGRTDEDSDEALEPLLAIPAPWPMVDGLVSRQVDSRTGKLASRWCPEDRVYTEIYLPGTEPTEVCDQAEGLFGRPGLRRIGGR